MTLGQVFGGWVAQIDDAMQALSYAVEATRALAIGGTAVGTGLNAHPDFGRLATEKIAAETGQAFRQAPDLFAALSAHDALVGVSAGLRTLGGVLMKARQRRALVCLRAAQRPRRACGSPRTSRAPRSCRARSTRPRPRR